ncbi:RagB/SusD family nutrient uptake outer membrane protein [Pararcticibacter amylolyticus]|uniref:RagB/SusD family nutrient uptake outer membrane protein n=1 Tax=Pararcticibacter amylolyticus TaxID=2173175 RepID=A0A2U2PIS2_9SPHI|nr:RagB/SusD family nutrient uptake outer membrane protein [Pararcticibacter amylolyticus]PWG81295.1 RagB/SusD family nutrient uptake outer membrane protein [Pararcticibacter amylolyticus]
MQRIYKILMIATLFVAGGCKDILEETPRDRFEPGFFKTEAGIRGGLTGLYSGLRRLYGQPYYYNATETGTDEYTYGQQADDNFRKADLSGLGIPDAQNSRWDVLWNTAYANINSASGIITNGTEANMPAALIAEARFFRSFSYFLLVQTFGGVPLDLGSGILTYNTKPTLSSVRNTVPEVYTIGIFPDLKQAVEELPDNPRDIGAVTKNVARLTLAKAYLTYAWWLQNPNNVPTYPETPRTDPDGHDAQWYFQNAYNIALDGINNPGPYALQPTFYDVNLAQNDRNKEIMLWADHTEANAQYSESNITGWDGGDGQNQAVWMVTWYFQNLKASSDPASWKPADVMFRTVQAGQSYSRPWMRMTPPVDVFTKTFSNKTEDSRFNGTFTTVYRGTWYLNTQRTEARLYGANLMPIEKNGKVLSFLSADPGGINYSNSTYNDNTEAGQLPGRADYVVPLDKISRSIYPGLWKLGSYRKSTDYNDDKIASSRPYNILKYSEFYFVAAEAAVKGASVQAGRSARELINVIRSRAGKWKFDVAENVEKVEDNSAAMVAATPASIDINYILDERSREFFGEGYRWHDLARTQKWEEYAGSYRISQTAGASPVTITRQLPKYLYLRPIPQGQLDRMSGDADFKKAYQNPGY